MESCYIPNNPQFGISLEYTAFNGGFTGYGHLTACDTGQDPLCCDSELQPCSCSQGLDIAELRDFRECEECQDSCDQNLNDLNSENLIHDDDGCGERADEINNVSDCAQSDGVTVADAPGYWTSEDMGSFSLPSLDLEPLPSLFPFSPCSGNYNRSSAAAAAAAAAVECRERGAEAADVLLSLKHAAVHGGDCGGAETQHPQVMVSPSNGGYPYYDQYGGAPPLFPTMSVNVSMNMTMHGYPPDQMCPQVQWNQNTTPPVNMMYPQSQAVISPTAYPSATYSFTADFRTPNQSDPLITATSSFKPLQIQPAQSKATANYGLFQKQQPFSNLSQKSLGQGISLRRSSSGYQPPPPQPPPHAQDYYPPCVSAGKVQVGALSGCSEDDDQKPNLCRICGKTYARPSTLKTHLRTHSGERPYRCADCNKSFSQAANLTAHVRTHTGQKPFRCPICDRRFSQSSSVTTHMRTHSGERPYRCRACKKAFSDSSTLTKHLRIHSGEKPYQCKLCLLRFSQSGNLNRHMRVHGNNAALLG